MSNFVNHSAHNKFIIHSAGENLESFVPAMAQMVRAGNFKPELSELSFGWKGQGLGEYKIEFDNGREILLRGKIDRLDIAQIDGEKISAVFDYKSKDKSFSWSKFYYGLDLQLGIYILAVTGSMGKAIGAFYIPVEAVAAKTTFSKLKKKSDSFNYKAKGIFDGRFFQQFDSSDSNRFYNFFVSKKGDQYGYDNRSGALRPDDFEAVVKFTQSKIIELTEQIVSGNIDIYPYYMNSQKHCDYCKYKSL